MRGPVLYFTQYGDFLTNLRNHELVAIAKEHIRRRTHVAREHSIKIDDEATHGPSGLELPQQTLRRHCTLRGLLALSHLSCLNGGCGQIRLQTLRESCDLFSLPLAELLTGEDRTPREGKTRQPTRALNDRTQRLTTTDGVGAREAHFTRDRDCLLLRPLREFLDDQRIERLQGNVCRRIASAHCSKVNLDELALAFIAP